MTQNNDTEEARMAVAGASAVVERQATAAGTNEDVHTILNRIAEQLSATSRRQGDAIDEVRAKIAALSEMASRSGQPGECSVAFGRLESQVADLARQIADAAMLRAERDAEIDEENSVDSGNAFEGMSGIAADEAMGGVTCIHDAAADDVVAELEINDPHDAGEAGAPAVEHDQLNDVYAAVARAYQAVSSVVEEAEQRQDATDAAHQSALADGDVFGEEWSEEFDLREEEVRAAHDEDFARDDFDSDGSFDDQPGDPSGNDEVDVREEEFAEIEFRSQVTGREADFATDDVSADESADERIATHKQLRNEAFDDAQYDEDVLEEYAHEDDVFNEDAVSAAASQTFFAAPAHTGSSRSHDDRDDVPASSDVDDAAFLSAFAAQSESVVPAELALDPADRAWLELRFDDLAARIDDATSRDSHAEEIASLREEMMAIHEQIAGLSPVGPSGATSESADLGDLGARLDGVSAQLERISEEVVRIEVIEDHIAQLIDEMNRSASNAEGIAEAAAIRAAESVVASLPERALAAGEAAEGSDARIDEIRELVEMMILERREGEENSSGALNEIHNAIASLSAQIEQIANGAVVAPAATHATIHAAAPVSPQKRPAPETDIQSLAAQARATAAALDDAVPAAKAAEEARPATLSPFQKVAAQLRAAKPALVRDAFGRPGDADKNAADATDGVEAEHLEAQLDGLAAAHRAETDYDPNAQHETEAGYEAVYEGGVDEASAEAGEAPEPGSREAMILAARAAARRAADASRNSEAAKPSGLGARIRVLGKSGAGKPAAPKGTVPTPAAAAKARSENRSLFVMSKSNPRPLLIAAVAVLVLAGAGMLYSKLSRTGLQAGKAKIEQSQAPVQNKTPVAKIATEALAPAETEQTTETADARASALNPVAGATAQVAAADVATVSARPSGVVSGLNIAESASPRFGTTAGIASAEQAQVPEPLIRQATQASLDTQTDLSQAVPGSQSNASQLDMPPARIGPLSLRTAAANGDAKAEFEVASRFAQGMGVDRDYEQAAAWYQRSAEQGYAPAQYRLAAMHERGRGVQQDLGRARIWYKRAADQGNVKAMHNLAVLFAGQQSGYPDYVSAVQWFTKAAEHGLKDSQFNLAILHENGLGLVKSEGKAYKWFALAAQQGDEEAAKRRTALRNRLESSVVSTIDTEVARWRPVPADPQVNVADPAGSSVATTAATFDADAAIADAYRPTKAEVAKVQLMLSRLGHNVGVIDGEFGPRTRDAIITFQSGEGMAATGTIDPDLISMLAAKTG